MKIGDRVLVRGIVDEIRKDTVIIKNRGGYFGTVPEEIEETEQEPKLGHCKDCKWWKDKDGVYRRGISAESKCPINRREVMEGRGYCFMFEPQESEVENWNDD